MSAVPDDKTLSQDAVQSSFATVGPYRLAQRLGIGGMGEVWRAEQTEPFRRTVALKLIKAGMDTAAVVARFDSERQALALMEHPNIAKVFDAGATEAGRPYFVMEYVHGRPITEYCDSHRLTVKERLGLFMQVCDGVQHAHQKAIIHRDLKPSNVLVEEVDDKPVPKIIDFGLAKATGQRLTDLTMLTEVGTMLGTPDYMSPEQADRDERNIDTRTDVYSLGVILYELLVGELPFASHELREAGAEAMLRKIREQDPPRPSTRLRSLGDTAKDSAGRRREQPDSLVRRLRGELDWITIKALEKERARRYGSPSDLAADIQRYLHDQPVLAGPPTVSYRAYKFIRRHRFGVAVAGAAGVLLIGFAATMALQARRIAKERDRANRIADFMTGMFKVADPSEARGNTITARAILDKASNDIKTGLAKDPEVQSELMFTMARTYSNLGLFSLAHGLSATALENRRRLLGPENPKTLESMTQLGWILDREGHDDDAQKLMRQAVDQGRRALGAENPVTLEAMDDLAVILEKTGHYEEEEKLQHQLIEIRTRRLGPEDPRTLHSMLNLAGAVSLVGRTAEAESMYRETLAAEKRVLGADHPQTIATMHNLANRIQEQGRYAEAEGLYRETLAAEQRVLGREHPDTASTMTTLASTIYYEGRSGEAEKLFRESLEIQERVVGAEHPYTTQALEGLANVLASQGHLEEAEKLDRQILEIRMRVLGPDHTDTLLSKYNLADVLFGQDHFSEAEKLIRETIASQARVLGPENADTLASRSMLAKTMLREGKSQEAEAMARQVFAIQLRVLGPQHLDTLSTLQTLGTALVVNNRYAEAKDLFSDVIQKVNKSQETNSPLAWYKFACVAAAAHDREEAVQHLREAVNHGYKDIDQIRTDDDLKVLRGYSRFEEFLSDSAKRADASSERHD
ncbi:MAG TPA: serine/threonine-protein kinase [Candidatus Sulfotelmatobacter sp.]